MMGWDQVHTGFAGEETSNFGPRVETGTALYQVDTIATISARNQASGEVKQLVTSTLGEAVCVGVDYHLSVFKDSQHQATIEFEDIVDDCAWSPDGSLLLVANADGKLSIFSADTFKSVFSFYLLPNGTSKDKAFYRITFKNNAESCDLVLLSTTGQLFVVQGFNSAVFCQDTKNLATVKEQVQFQTVQTNEVHTDTAWDAVPLGNGNVITVGSGDSILAVWSWQDNGLFLDGSTGDMSDTGCYIVSAKLASNNTMLYALDGKNQVSIWHVPELILLTCTAMLDVGSETIITDFLLLETQGTQSNSVEGTRLVMQEQGKLCNTIRIIEAESWKDIYTLQLAAPVSLAKCSTTQESLYVAEGVPAMGIPGQVSTVRIRCLTETNPETRLQRILRKKRFDEALQFACLFQLDKELVYTAQMKEILKQLSPRNVFCYDKDTVQTMMTQLWASINNIKNCQVIDENCMETALPTFVDTWKLLQLCHNKLSSATTDNSESERQQALQNKVLALQNRLMTYKVAFGVENYSAKAWTDFQQANLVHMMLHKMAEHPHTAIILWKRHSEEWQDEICLEEIQHCLQAVPQRLMGPSIMGWLQDDLVPYITKFLPHAMGEVVQWSVQRASKMELMEKDGWPGNAISFLEGLNSCITKITEVNFTNTNDTAAETVTKTQVEVFSVLEPLRSILSLLRQLQDLLKYNLRLSIGQFQQETVVSLAFRMLDQVMMVELMKPALEKYILPYMRAHLLDQDDIFATYIKDLLERLGHMRSYSGQSLWEKKLLAIVSFIQSPKEKCCAVVNVIKHAPLPWSPKISALVEEGLKIEHPLARELQEQKKLASIRLLMQEYGLKGINITEQKRVQKLAVFIVEQDKPTSLEDGLRVLKEHNITSPPVIIDVYFHYANLIIRADRISDYLNTLRSMDLELAKNLGERVVSLAEISLAEDIPQPAVRQILDQHKQYLTVAAVLTLQFLIPKASADQVKQDELKHRLMIFTNLCALQREYKMILPVTKYCDEVNRGLIFANFTKQFLKENKAFQGSGNMTALHRLADLLQLKWEAVLGELAVVEGNAGNLDAAIFLCRQLLEVEPSKDGSRVLHRVVSALLQLQGQDESEDDSDGADVSSKQDLRRQLPHVLQKLADRAVVMCDPEILMSCLNLSKAARLWQQVNVQCEVTDLSTVQSEMAEWQAAWYKDPLEGYTDEALVMNSSIALPLAASSLAATVAVVEGDEALDEDEENGIASAQNAVCSLTPVVYHLRDNNHLQLALRYLTFTVAALRQSVSQHDMGYPLSPEVQSWLDTQRSAMQNAEKGAVQLFNSLTTSLIMKVLNAHRVDHEIALSYLLSVPRKVSVDCLMKSITTCNFNFRKLQAIARVGVELGHMLRESKLISTCQEVETGATWGVRLAKLKISFKEAFQGGLSAKHNVIVSMARCEWADVNLVADFSVDFRMEADTGLMLFMEELLKNCQGTSHLVRAKAAVSAVEDMDRTSSLLTKLRSVYKQTNPYNYEVIEFLLGELSRLDYSPLYEKGLNLLSYLKVYTRHNPPSEYEVSSLSMTHEHMEEGGDAVDGLPQGSSHRVPIRLLLEGEPWKIITAELDAETVPLWLKIAELLELSTDEVYMMAVQNIVRHHVSNTTSAKSPWAPRDKSKPTSIKSWTASEASLQMLEQVQHLLSSVRNCELALACANWVVKELPMGGDKILGLQGCVAFAHRWYQVCEDNMPKKEKALAARNKFQKFLFKVLTEQALHLHSLAEPELLQLVAKPLDLITCLTEHDAVVAQIWESGPVPDIYSAVRKVCEVNDLDLGHILVTAVQKWLLTPDTADDGEVTMNLSFSNLKMTEGVPEIDEKDSIKRVLYFLHRGPKREALNFLLSTVQTCEEEGTSQLGRMQCLYCLLQIANDTDLQPLGHTCDSIREMLRVSCYLAQLEALHINHSSQTLTDCSKGSLVKAIWKNHRHQKSAVTLSAALCLDYKLYDRNQWTLILLQMINLNMLSELEEVLQRLRSVTVLRSLSVLPSAWTTVLLTPLNKAMLPLTEEQTKNCLHCFNLLQSCPVLAQLDLTVMKQHFQRLELRVCGAACMMMDPTLSHNHVQEMLSHDFTQLIEDTYTLTRLGLSFAAATQVREAIFLSLLQQNDYDKVEPQALKDFIHFIIRQDNIDGCLVFAISNDILAQAESLVEMYFQHYPQRYAELRAWCDKQGCENESVLQAYVQMKQLM